MSEKAEPKIYALTETAINIVFGNDIHPEIHKRVKNMMEALEESPFPGFVECVPSYVGVTVFYNPVSVYNTMEEKGSPMSYVTEHLRAVVHSLEEGAATKAEGKVVTIPVCYGESFGPDLANVAESNDLTVDEVIHIHTGGEYLVYMIGFAPGFSFLGGMSQKIATPRRHEPRTHLPAVSVGIAGRQTGVYPFETPGGWQIIGQTPLKMFDVHRDQPSLLTSGDTVYFKAISREEFDAYKEGDM